MIAAQVAPLPTAHPAGVRVVQTSQDMAAINQPNCAALIWQRSPDPEVAEWLAALAPDNLPKARLILPVSEVRAEVEQCCEGASMPKGCERDALIGDIAYLTDQFATVMKVTHVRLRLDVVNTNACRKFHRDVIRARLVCTYLGTGTQYGTGTRENDPRQVFTVPPCCPIVMRGSEWPETPASDLLHRSPPIEGTGETRLVLVVDPIYDFDEAF
jgi:hypothetical protein